MRKTIHVVLVDDHRMLREGLVLLINDEPDIEVVAEAGTAEEVLPLVEDKVPDVVVMDLGLPGMSGLDAIRAIKTQAPDVRIVVLSMHHGRDMVMQALEAGADGFVPKSAAHNNLLQAIRTVQSGERFLDPTATTAVVDELLERNEEAELVKGLSNREREVLKWTALGYTSREIGKRLSLSPKTVETYRLRAMEKLDFEHRSDLIRFALKAGLMEDEIE